MTPVREQNLAHKRGPGRREVIVLACLLARSLLAPAAAPAATPEADPSATPASAQPVPPPIRPPEIVAPPMPSTPEAGKGRLALVIGGKPRRGTGSGRRPCQ